MKKFLVINEDRVIIDSASNPSNLTKQGIAVETDKECFLGDRFTEDGSVEAIETDDTERGRLKKEAEEKNNKRSRILELSKKETLNLQEINEVLKIHNLI